MALETATICFFGTLSAIRSRAAIYAGIYLQAKNWHF